MIREETREERMGLTEALWLTGEERSGRKEVWVSEMCREIV